jgi:hypothetical protein
MLKMLAQQFRSHICRSVPHLQSPVPLVLSRALLSKLRKSRYFKFETNALCNPYEGDKTKKRTLRITPSHMRHFFGVLTKNTFPCCKVVNYK